MRFQVAVCVLLVGARLMACDCAPPPPPPKKAMEGAEAVFLGEAVAVEVVGETRTVTLKVETWWKGGDAPEITVATHKSGATCGYGFEKGKKYLVYAYREGKQKALRTDLCGRTSTEKEADKNGDFKELGAGKKPAEKAPERTDGERPKLTAADALRLAEKYVEAEKIDVSQKFVVRVRYVDRKVVDTNRTPYWEVSYEPTDRRALGGEVWVSIGMDGKGSHEFGR